jgi:predicted ribosomally synthesized peptide with SipW-like signal peptide
MMKKAWFWVLVVVLTTALSVAGTLTYLQDVEKDVNVVTIGNVDIEQLEYERVDPSAKGTEAEVRGFENDLPLFPAVVDPGYRWNTKTAQVNWQQIGNNASSKIWDPNTIENERDKFVFVKNKGLLPAYVRTVFAIESGNMDWTTFRQNLRLNIDETAWSWEWVETPVTIGDSNFFIATATYNQPLRAGQFTEPSLSQVALDCLVENDTVMSFGDSYLILAKTQAVQSDGFQDPKTALEEGFGAIAVNEHPFLAEGVPTYVYTEEDLKRAAERGGMAVLMKDIEITSRTYFTKKGCVLDMAGHAIINSNMDLSRTCFAIRVDSGGSLVIKGNGKFIDNHTGQDLKWSVGVFCVSGAGSVLTIEDGYYDVGNNDACNMLVQAQSNGKFVVYDGIFESKGATSAGDLVYAMSGSTIELYGGFFRNDGASNHVINVNDGRPGYVDVVGGTFVEYVPGKTCDTTCIKVAEGYTVICETQPDGENWYKVVPVG